MMIILTACEDILPGGYGTITVKVDGVKETFKWNAGAGYMNGATDIGASDKRNHPDKWIGIHIYLPIESISEKTYSGTDVGFDYIDYCGYSLPYGYEDTSVTVTEIDSKHIKGTFSGFVNTDNHSDKCPGSRMLTDGSFDVDF